MMNGNLAFNVNLQSPFSIYSDKNRERKVVFYGRVSTEHEEQISALENQMQWYEDQAKMHPNWTVVGKYIDEGITGTQAKKRPAFLKMIEDAKKYKFDLIVTREVCRFARNTVDTLVTTRMLKNLGIEVYFVEDNIWTMDGDGELRLTIMATLAQEESRKVSERVKAGQHISRVNGVIYGNGNILGYDRVNGTYVINEEQAETIRMMFRMYNKNEWGMTKICNELTRLGRKNASGEVKWSASVISRALSNPTYMGYMAYGKSFSNNYLEQKRINNHNKETYMMVKCDFEPIVTEEEWYKCEKLRQSRRASLSIPMKKKTPFGEEEITKPKRESHDLWNKRLQCKCGHSFRKNRWHKNKGKEISYGYQCYNQLNNGSAKKRRELGKDSTGYCDMTMIADWKLDVMCKVLLEEIWTNRQDAIFKAETLIKENYRKKKIDPSETMLLSNKIQRIKQKLENLIEMRTEGDITKEDFRKRKGQLEQEIECYENELEEMKEKEYVVLDDGLDWNKIHEALEELIDFSKSKIDDAVVDKFVAKVVPQDKYRYKWYINLSGKRPEEVNMYLSGRKNKATVYIDKSGTSDYSEEEDGGSSIHTRNAVVERFSGKRYSLVPTRDRQLLTTNKL